MSNPQIRYSPEWIEKILSGQKTMTYRRTQYPCGVYDVVNDASGEVVGQIEVVKVEKFDMGELIDRYIFWSEFYWI